MSDPLNLDAIELEFRNWIITQAEARRTNPSMNLLLFLIYIHPNSTQKDLQLLTKLSSGTISTFLKNLIDMNLIQSDFITGTHTRRYNTKNYSITLFSAVESHLIKELNSSKQIIFNYENEIALISSKFPDNDKILLFRNRLRLIRYYFKLYEEMLLIMNPNTANFLKSPDIKGYSPFMNNIDDKSIHDLLDYQISLANFMKSNYIFNPMNSIKSHILAYFFVFPHLTYKELKEFTNLSIGVISESVQFYISSGIISENSEKKGRATVYSIQSLGDIIYKIYSSYILKKLAWKSRAEIIWKDFQSYRSKFYENEYFNRLYEFISQIITDFPIQEKLLEKINEFAPILKNTY